LDAGKVRHDLLTNLQNIYIRICFYLILIASRDSEWLQKSSKQS
jgi:hypothetical protein